MDKATRLQIASDKIYNFAETIQALDEELGQLCSDIGDDLWQKVEGICPWHTQIGPDTVKQLSSLARDLEPPGL